ncbi:hypothetical protein CAL26_09370 [Bordetella genomosp. 9]|uniref:Uncharacterized protein n=1 Tax=Bordetella genomosp. 9 TaxID=1416803 RepID=A0A261RGG3_9BORD|nr:hypothetical protein [Bordetella genomosp. 9]OZI24045.1 hypothetical protein CAL26_09370 [Bordetella genomosp. 9]
MRRHSCGQALPLALGLAGLGALSLVVLYNLGQTVAARARLTHAADAAAYSGALVQARALNMIAYINRAQVAHQVAMAHLVTLATWTRFGHAEGQRVLRGNPPAAVIGMLFGPAHGQAYASAAVAANAGGLEAQFGRAYERHDATVHRVLAAAMRETLARLPDTRMQAMRAVVRANYPEFQAPVYDAIASSANGSDGARDRLGLQVRADDWPGFVRRYAGQDRGALRATVLEASGRYGFLGPRNRDARNSWPVSFRCPTWRHELRRRGGTRLGGDGRWRSIDTQSFHKVRSNKYIGCYYREYAMGWGKANARGAGGRAAGDGGPDAPDVPEDFSRQDFWRWVRQHTSWDIVNGVSNPLAYAYAMRDAKRWSGAGLPPYAEVPLSRSGKGTRFVLALRQPAPLLATTDAGSTVASPTGRLAYAGLTREDDVTVLSAAETYFARPHARRDGADELATLFRPYWQARLTGTAQQAGRHGE